jgi:hypothetical protein
MNVALDLARSQPSPQPFPWIALASRLVLFPLFQAPIALALALGGEPAPWQASAAWWPVTATLTNFVSVALLRRHARAAGSTLRRLYGVDGRHLGRDVLTLLAVLLVAAPVAHLPNVALAGALFGDAAQAFALFVRPLPYAVAAAMLVLFPLSIALSELPTYYAMAQPQLEARGLSRGRALWLAAGFHSAQHATLPLLFDARFFTWRLLMFLPFALLVGAVVRWRPSLLPWLMGVHVLIDFAVIAQVFALSG